MACTSSEVGTNSAGIAKVCVATNDGQHKHGTPMIVAAWLVEQYGDGADAHGISGSTVAVDDTYHNMGLLLGWDTAR